MLDEDLALLFGVPTKRLNEQVSRNRERLPADFMFQLKEEEAQHLRSQVATSSENIKHGGRRYLPFAFSEHGVLMLASVLRSESAVQMSIMVARAFVKMRELLETHRDLMRRLEELEGRMDGQFSELYAAFRSLMKQETDRSPIGFKTKVAL